MSGGVVGIDVGGGGGEKRRSLDEGDLRRREVSAEELNDLRLYAGCFCCCACSSMLCMSCVVCEYVDDDSVAAFECDGYGFVVLNVCFVADGIARCWKGVCWDEIESNVCWLGAIVLLYDVLVFFEKVV